MDRKYAAQIAYPFVSADPVAGEEDAYLDALLYVSPADVDQGIPVGNTDDLGPVGAWLVSRSQDTLTEGTITMRAKVPVDADSIDTSLDVAGSGAVYINRTFIVDTTTEAIQVITGDDDRSVLVVDASRLTTIPVGNALGYMDAAVEPGCVVPVRRQVISFNVYNEYRAKDPADRASLPPDERIQDVLTGGTVSFNDGYNCAVAYDPDTGILRFTGGIGLGKGQPDSNPWDDDDNTGLRGIRTVNGINNDGVVDVQAGSGVLAIGTSGDLELRLRDQGDDD
jgi:hypothetical protein